MKILSYKFITSEGELDISGMTPRLALSVLYSLEGVSFEYSIVEGKPIRLDYIKEYLFNIKKHFSDVDTSEYTIDTLVELILEETERLPPFGGITLTAYYQSEGHTPEKITQKHMAVSSKCPNNKLGKQLTLDLLEVTGRICLEVQQASSNKAIQDSSFMIKSCADVLSDLYTSIVERKSLNDPKFQLTSNYYIEVEFL